MRGGVEWEPTVCDSHPDSVAGDDDCDYDSYFDDDLTIVNMICDTHPDSVAGDTDDYDDKDTDGDYDNGDNNGDTDDD